tara:strand:- start:24598 stop:25053 length:456 start_codon:yes stop_codon:yes gene_type:complete
MRYTPEIISDLEENQVFVFGSNLAGRHGAGAALLATKTFGAKYGVGEGMTGKCYAFPTKDENIKTRSLYEIGESFNKFFHCVSDEPRLDFLLTKVGCGLAGYSTREMANTFWNSMDWLGRKQIPKNLWVPKEFIEYRAEQLLFESGGRKLK